MMSCTQVRPILSFLIEKETGPLETLEARRHLDVCEPCRLRAERLSRVMAACGRLAEQAPPSDVASVVMERLRALKASAAAAPGALLAFAAARWSGLVVLLGAALGMAARPESPMMKALGAPLAFLAGRPAAGGSPDGAASALERAVALATSLNGGMRAVLPAGAALDLVVSVQVLATALAIGFVLAIPVAIVTSWLLHSGTSGRRFPRL